MALTLIAKMLTIQVHRNAAVEPALTYQCVDTEAANGAVASDKTLIADQSKLGQSITNLCSSLVAQAKAQEDLSQGV